MNAVIVICLAYMALVALYMIVRLTAGDRRERLEALKNFKKGKFALIYLAAIPLYFIAYSSAGEAADSSLLQAVTASVRLAVLDFEVAATAHLAASSTLYRATMNVCYILVAANAVLFTASVAGRAISNLFRRIRAFSAKNVYIIVGSDAHSVEIAKSAAEKRRDKSLGRNDVLLLGYLNGDGSDEMFVAKIAHMRAGGVLERLPRLFGSFSGRRVNVIVNTGDDAANLLIVERISDIISSLDLAELAVDERCGLYAYVFGAPENASAFIRFSEKTKGCVRYVNKYKLVAYDFADRYPLTEFMDERHLDYAAAAIRPDLDVNVAMIGFGKTAREIFMTSVANNQFLKRIDGDMPPVECPVAYHIYDRNKPDEDKNLNHNYFRYAGEFSGYDPREYLPLPPKPADEHFYRCDINHADFYASLKSNLTAAAGRRAYNYLIVAFGTDMENLDLADKLAAKLEEWRLKDTTKLFVKIRDDTLDAQVVVKEYPGLITFGNEAGCIYNVGAIIDERAERMARMRHLSYASAYNPDKSPREIGREAREIWFSQYTRTQRESNVYACLSLRFKLQLTGYDFVPSAVAASDESAEFWEDYTRGDPVAFSGEHAGDRALIDYSGLDYGRDSVRRAYAVQEHARWNAYMICSGFVPATIEEIATRNKGKLFSERKHGNITTFDGLKLFAEIVAENYATTPEAADVIKYDYQIMDDAVWLLKANACSIVKRKA